MKALSFYGTRSLNTSTAEAKLVQMTYGFDPDGQRIASIKATLRGRSDVPPRLGFSDGWSNVLPGGLAIPELLGAGAQRKTLDDCGGGAT